MTGAVLEVRGLAKHYPLRRGVLARIFSRGDEAVVRAVDDVSFSLGEGEVIGLVGESGCGKSTTGLTVLKLVEPTAGEIRFLGEDVAPWRGRALRRFRRQAQMIFQDPYQSLNPRFTVRDIVGEPLLIHGLARGQDARDRVVETLERSGLRPAADFLERFPHELSGGQRQRVSIARAMVLEPRLLIADEPVSMLDVSVRAGILKLLRRLSEDTGLSIVYISHDISTVRYLCDRTAVMYLGRIAELGRTEDVIRGPCHPYTRALLAAVPRIGTARRTRVRLGGEAPVSATRHRGCAFHPRCPEAFAPCPENVPPLDPVAAGHAVACHLFGPGGGASAPAPATETITKPEEIDR